MSTEMLSNRTTLLSLTVWLKGVVNALLFVISADVMADAEVRSAPFNEQEKFDVAAASRVFPVRRAEMDIEFFNEFWVKGEFPTEQRVQKIRALAKEGFEIAYLADRLYNFERGGIPRFGRNYLPDWQRLKALAEIGDPSAQCLFAHTASEYRSFKLDPPTSYDQNVLAHRYRKEAALHGHPYCLRFGIAEMTSNDDQKDLEAVRKCAALGVTMCESGMAARYSGGRGVPKDLAKGMCWVMRARRENAALSVESYYRNYRWQLQKEFGDENMEELLKLITPATDCETLAYKGR